jgi:uncharacterized Zn finger protein (UPF0148 family)
MYCKECGNPLKEDDLFCTKCGAKVKGSEFTWDIYKFPEPKKTDSIDFDWSVSDDEEDIGIDADLFRGIEDGGPSGSIDEVGKFFTFHQKNEEFQKLLDRELERINEDNNQAPRTMLHKKETTKETTNEVVAEVEVPIEESASEVEAPIEESAKEAENDGVFLDWGGKELTETIPLWFEQGEDEVVETQKKGLAKRILLAFVILLILVEVGALGTRYFWPESEAAIAVSKVQISVSETFLHWKDRVVGFFESLNANEEPAVLDPSQEDPATEEPDSLVEPDEGNEIVVKPSPIPVADKNALIEASAGNNENIKSIRANTTLAYQDDHDYKVKDLNLSKPIENNIWMETEEDGVRYYDQELVSTLISFDSKWIDYVNDSDDSVLGLVKKSSRAYQNVSTYSKVGEVEQTFLLLEIGEIRQGEKGYYVWTYEEIQEVAGSKTTLKKYHWIYYLDVVEGEMRIADYYYYGA